MREPRRAVAAVLLGLSAAIGTVDTLAVWGADTERQLLLVQIGLALVALFLALVGSGRNPLGSLTNRLRSARRSALPFAALVGWLAWAGLGVVTAEFAQQHVALTWASMVAAAAAAGAVMLSLGWYGGALVAASAVGGHALLAGVAMATADFDMSEGRLRLVALEPNQLARPVALAALLATVVAIESAGRRDTKPARAIGRGSSVGWAVLALVSVGTLVLTESRTATVALGAAAAVWIIVNRRYRVATFLGLGLVAALVLMSSLGLTGKVADRLSRSESTTSEVLTLTGRTSLWPLVLDRAKEDRWTGVGVGNDRQVVVEAVEEGELGWTPQHAHNLGLHLLLVSGVPGVVLAGLAIVLAAAAALRRRDAVSVAVVVLLMIDGLSEAVFTNANLAWTLLACAVAAPLLPTRAAAQPDEPEPVDVAGERSRRSFDLARPAGAWLASVSVATAVAVVVFTPFDFPHRLRCSDLPASSAALIDVVSTDLTGEAVGLPDQTAKLVRCAGMVDGGFTLEMTVSTDRIDQVGPARIFTLSEGADWGDIDFHVGQEGTALSLRRRLNSNVRSDHLIEGMFTEPGELRNIAVTVTRDGAEVYLDGELQDSITAPVAFDSWAVQMPALLGNEATGDRPFVGHIGHLRIWRGALDAEAIQALSSERP